MSVDQVSILKKNLQDYKKKLYLSKLIRSLLFLTALSLTVYLLANSFEFAFQFGTTGRTILFFGMALTYLGLFISLILLPLIRYIKSSSEISDELAARQIKTFFPEHGDKLLNTIQLEGLDEKSGLIAASIEQRSRELSVINFDKVVDLKTNRRYLKYIFVPGLITTFFFVFIPQFLTESTTRIVNYDVEFKPLSLFQINVRNEKLETYRNEDFELVVDVSGIALPESIYVSANGRRYKMKFEGDSVATYTFPKVQADMDIQISAADYASPVYHLNVYQRPEIRSLNITSRFPKYTGMKPRMTSNTGNVQVPEGTYLQWQVETLDTDQLEVHLGNKKKFSLSSDNQLYTYGWQALSSDRYVLDLKNKHGSNSDSIIYNIETIKDAHPGIIASYFQDTTLFSYIALNGSVKDDYGISKLEIVYSLNGNEKTKPIPFSKNMLAQNYFYQWTTDSLGLSANDELEFFVRVWDNDGINGAKSTSSQRFSFKISDVEEIRDNMNKESSNAKNSLDRTLNKAKEINDELSKLEDDLKRKKEMDWQEKKRLNDLIKQKEELEKDLEKLSEQNRTIAERQNHFNEPSEDLKEKARNLQKLMDEVLDEETKKLYEELKKLLEENGDSEQIEDLVNQIQNKEENIEKEIERALEMFKRLQFEYKMNEVSKLLEELSEEQKENSQETKEGETSKEELLEEQNKVQEKFDDVKEQMENLDELNDNLKMPEQMEKFDEDQSQIDEELEMGKELLENNKQKKASESQQKSGKQMKKMQQKMQDMMASMQAQAQKENLEHLRQIVENLVTLSFDQEYVMKEFRGVSQSDPRFVTLSQKQLKIKDDAVIIEDSLLSLASRVFQIQSFVTREVDEMNDNIEKSLQALKDRHKSEAISNQQYAMTSINNLALLLDDALEDMMQNMAAMPMNGKDGDEKLPSMSELQKQLNQRIEELKKSGKSGRQLSQELAELAAEQEMIRQQLKKMEEKLGPHNQNAKSGLSEAIKKMEQTEVDLVNKNLTRQMIQRQKDILTRMLEAEKSMMERELDEQRKGKEAENISRNYPPEIEEFLKAKEKETDLLHTVPSKMNPYYKEEVNKYFDRLNEQ